MIDVWDLISMSLDIVFMQADAIINNFKKKYQKYWKFMILENFKAKKFPKFSWNFRLFGVWKKTKIKLSKEFSKKSFFLTFFSKSEKIETFRVRKFSNFSTNVLLLISVGRQMVEQWLNWLLAKVRYKTLRLFVSLTKSIICVLII